MEGKLHNYHPSRPLNVFEYTPPAGPLEPGLSETTPNVLLFVGGLFDNFFTPPYVSDLARLFPRRRDQQWTVMHVQLSSAMRSWGMFDLHRDIEEIAVCINYIRQTIRNNQPTNIVLMGHSTGCQDIVHYLYSANPPSPKHPPRPPVQGAILQAPVSDREALLHQITTDPKLQKNYDKCIDLANSIPEPQHRTNILPTSWTTPLYGPAPISISRFLSLSSPNSPSNPSIDDLFSSDLTDDRLNQTFGSISTNNLLQPPITSLSHPHSNPNHNPQILILISDSDEGMPPHISKPTLLTRWSKALSNTTTTTKVTLHPKSTIIPHATHDISGTDALSQKARLIIMRDAVTTYCHDIVGGVGDDVWRVIDGCRRILSTTKDNGDGDDGDGILDSGVKGLKL